MYKKTMIIIMIFLLSLSVNANEEVEMSNDEIIASQYVKTQFLIAKSTKSYKEAKQFAVDLAKKTGIKLDLRGLSYHEKLKLSFSQQVCENEGYDVYPCYYPRGRMAGVFISIEYSNSYEGFSKGYYIVIVANGDDIKQTLPQVKSIVKDAYIKTTTVYMGCMH